MMPATGRSPEDRPAQACWLPEDRFPKEIQSLVPRGKKGVSEQALHKLMHSPSLLPSFPKSEFTATLCQPLFFFFF